MFDYFTRAWIKYFFSVPSDALALKETSLRRGLFVDCGATLISNLNSLFESWTMFALIPSPSSSMPDIVFAKSGFKTTNADFGAAASPTDQKSRLGLMVAMGGM